MSCPRKTGTLLGISSPLIVKSASEMSHFPAKNPIVSGLSPKQRSENGAFLNSFGSYKRSNDRKNPKGAFILRLPSLACSTARAFGRVPTSTPARVGTSLEQGQDSG